jgi:KaiC/GvpD/RAD55 family RecA-like ATPase
VINPIDDEEPLFPDGNPLVALEAPAKGYSGKAAWKATEGLRIEDTDAWMLRNPTAAQEILKGARMVTGDQEIGKSDIRFGAIPITRHLDPRRYGTGLAAVTAHMGEIRPGELVVVGAREGHGKSAWAEMMALSNARDFKVLYVTLEMTPEEVRDRMLAKKLACSLEQLEREQREQSGRYKAATALIGSFDLLVWQPEKKDRSIGGIMKRAVDVSAAMLFIDYTRRIGGWKPGDTAGEIMDTLSEFVRSSSITTVLLAQLNRDAAGRKPTNANFQDSGKIEQAADRCILLHRPFLGQPAQDNVCEIVVSKNRQGPCFKAHSFWNGATMSFASMDERDEMMVQCCKKKRKGDDDD